MAAGITGLPILTMRLGLALLCAGAALLALDWGWGPTLLGAGVAGIGYGTVSVVVNRRVLTEMRRRAARAWSASSTPSSASAPSSRRSSSSPAGGRPGPVFWLHGGRRRADRRSSPRPSRPAPPAPRGLPPLRDPRLLLLLFNMASITIEVMLSSYGASALIDLGISDARPRASPRPSSPPSSPGASRSGG